MLEQTQTSAPSLPTIVSGRDMNNTGYKWSKVEQGSFNAAADAQNQLNMAKYNNDYNYWLWKLQTEYNDPVQQVARLKRAGLNTNFNSIEGAGNASSPSPSTGSLKSNFLGAYQADISSRAQRLNEINAVISSFNDLVKNVGEGFDMYRTYVNTPDNPQAYRRALTMLTAGNAGIAQSNRLLKQLYLDIGTNDRVGTGGNPFGYVVAGDGDLSSTPLGQAYLGEMGGKAWQSQIGSARYQSLLMDNELKTVVKGLKEFELNKLSPKKLELLEEQIDNLFSRTQFIDTQNDMYTRLKVGGMLLPLALMLFKSIL